MLVGKKSRNPKAALFDRDPSVHLFFHCLLFGFIMCYGTQELRAQPADIRGVVADSSNGNRLQFVNIVLLGTTIGTTTNVDGFFLLPSILPGEYELRASYVGYETAVRNVDLKSGQSLSANFSLKPTAINLEEVPVSARGGAEHLKSATSKHFIERQLLERVPLGGQGDIFHSLKILPGIVSTSDISSKFHVRGGASDQNLFYLDEIKIYNPYHAMGIFSIFDPDLIGSTEIFTGSFPAGYGGRLSSVVKLKTRDGNATRSTGSAGLNSLSSKLLLEVPISNNLRTIVAGRKSLFRNTWKRFLSGNPPIEFYDFAAKMTFDNQETQTKAHVLAFVTEDDLGSNFAGVPSYLWKNSGLGVSISGLLDERVFVKSTASYTSYAASLVPAENSGVNGGATSVDEFAIRSEITVYLGSEEFLIGGFDFGFPTVSSRFVNSSEVTRTVRDTYPAISSWLRYQTKVGRYSIDAGIHGELGLLFTQKEGFAAFQPRVNVGIEIAPPVQLKFGYGRFSQNMVTINNEDELISLFDYWILIPDEIGPQRADHYVVALDWSLDPSVAMTAESYYKDSHSLVTFNREKVDAIDPDYVRGNGKSFGAEILIRFRQTDLDVYASYGFGKTEIYSGGESFTPRFDRRQSMKVLAVLNPYAAFSVTGRWEFGSGFPFTPATSTYFRFFISDLTPESYLMGAGESYLRLGQRNASRLPSYFRFDLAAEYSFRLWEARGNIGIHVLNLFDRSNLFYLDRASGRRIDMIRFFPSITASLTF
jgi:hypothetical protein